MGTNIRAATPSDLSRVVEVLDRGFAADPTARWALPTREEFDALHPQLVALWVQPALPMGAVHVCPDFAGAAVWYPPGAEMDGEAFAQVAAGASRPDRTASVLKLIAACERYKPSEPFWELELLAVDAAHRGKGIGADLLRYGLALCDRDDAPAYLESSNPANLSLYRRHGFDLLAEVQLPGTPKRFPMLRKPRARR